mgnify:CR=1 FL=1
MREYTTAAGIRQFFYEPHEIEHAALDALGKAHLLPEPSQDVCTVDLETLIERDLKVKLDQYADLPAEVLGMTEFPIGRAPKVSLNKDLTGAMDEELSAGIVGRWRATLAHEAAHVLLHRWLFDLDSMQRGLFKTDDGDRSTETLMRCLKRDVGHGRQGSDPREVQANMGMSALLMPKPALVKVVKQSRVSILLPEGPIRKESQGARDLIAEVARRFAVSKQAAGIRLETLAVLSDAAQRTLKG